MEVEQRDINRTPPTREFLERHVRADDLGSFMSTRSPAFRTRPLPATKREAIDLMLEQPNLIKRPILVIGPKVLFGFDKREYDRLA